MYEKLKEYGLDENFIMESKEYEDLYIARVSAQFRDLYNVISIDGEIKANVSGKYIYDTDNPIDYPTVGDWVMIDRTNNNSGNGIIHQVLKRKSLLERKSAGSTANEQAVASNIDTIFICMSLNEDFNIRRVERYLTIAWDSNAQPVIVLTKSDICEDLEEKLEELEPISLGVDIIITSSLSGDGMEEIKNYIKEGKTIAFIGSSGVGKSTLINSLIGEEVLRTKEIRNDDKGRHTTTHRQLLLLPNGGIVIDTPGMREIQLSGGNVERTFEDIEELASQCKFNDCTHKNEPKCKIREAIENGSLSQSRFDNYKKLKREVLYSNMNARQLENEKIKHFYGSKNEMKKTRKYLKDLNNKKG